MRGLQEKFQVVVSSEEEAGEPWASADGQRDLRGVPMWNNATSAGEDTRKFNTPPPGMEISNQQYSEQNQMPYSVAGESDDSKDTNPEAFARGFTRKPMSPSDDMCGSECVDTFYGDAGGFVERNNYLDRM